MLDSLYALELMPTLADLPFLRKRPAAALAGQSLQSS